MLFRLKHETEWEQLAMTVGNDLEFRYREDTETIPTYPHFTSVDLNDGEWVIVVFRCFYFERIFLKKLKVIIFVQNSLNSKSVVYQARKSICSVTHVRNASVAKYKHAPGVCV